MKTKLPYNILEDIICYMESKYNELTSGDMPDSEGICFDIAKYITFLKNMKSIYNICDKCNRHISPDEIYSISDEQIICSECIQEI